VKLSKKKTEKKRRDDTGHCEGKHWCNCRMRGIRVWLGMKRGGRLRDCKEGMRVESEMEEGT
jgi:hypothetical protein